MSIAFAGLNPPLRISPTPVLSVEEFWRFSFENPDLRMERSSTGDILVMTPTHRSTGFLGSQINRALGNWGEQNGTGYAFDSSTGFTLPDSSVMSPDAAWIHSSRWSPDAEDSYTATLAPDFVIELRSKTDRVAACRTKMEAWVANGVKLAWLIDPDRKVVEIYRPGASPEVQNDHAAVHGEGPVAGFVLDLRRIWS